MNLKKFFIGLAAAFSLVAVGTSVSQSNTAYAADQKIVVNKAKKQVEYPAVVNGTYFTQPTRHLCVYKNGSNGDKAVLRGEASEITFYNDLKKIGAKPGNNLRPADMKAAKGQGKRVEGSKLNIYIKWKGHKAVPVQDCIKSTKKYKTDFRFGGNLGRAQTMNTGCVACFDSCSTGIVSDHAWPTGSTEPNDVVKFYGNQKVLPKDGTHVTMIVKLAEK